MPNAKIIPFHAKPITEITLVKKQRGTLSKRFSIGIDKRIKNDSSACNLVIGKAERVPISSLHDVARVIVDCEHNEAVCLGSLHTDLPDNVPLATKNMIDSGEADSDAIARVGANIGYLANSPAVVLLDVDLKHLPPHVAAKRTELGGVIKALRHVLPDFAAAGYVIRKSTSSGITNEKTGKKTVGGYHVFVILKDGSDAKRFLYALHDRCWLAGLGWFEVGRAGQFLDRSLIDRSVFDPARLVFEGPPEIGKGLTQAPRHATVYEGDLLDSFAACRDLTPSEEKELKRLKSAAAEALEAKCSEARASWEERQTKRLIRRGVSPERAQQTVQQWSRGTLTPDALLDFDDPAIGTVACSDVLKEPQRFDGLTLADPLEGPSYGKCKARIFVRDDGSVAIHSFAHGGCNYKLLTTEESEYPRASIQCPAADGELTPIMQILDKHLLTNETLPPMRSIEGWPVEIRKCEPIGLHELSASGANADDGESDRLAPPPAFNIARHTSVSLSMLIERYIEFYTINKRGATMLKRLPSAFVNAYLEFERSRLPRVASVATMPLVLPNGELLGTNGLDRRRKIAFCIDAGILPLLPNGPIHKDKIAEAMRFLLDEWLVDVSTDTAGKCIIVALALTILERELLAERPAFFITAGKRGGGKTTLAHMVSLAVFGQRAAAASWSPAEEERRKAIFAALLQSVPMICFDNIKRGTAISCPMIERMLTSTETKDRILGESRQETVSTKVIVVFTGNNVAPRSDMASRSLIARINVERPDPENREFQHPDPFAWTLDNRGKIIAALYTVLLGNPRLKHKAKESTEKTRFKSWWRLVGSAVEYAAALVKRDVDFRQMFLDVEADDEETLSLIGLLPILDKLTDGRTFSASDVAEWMESAEGSDDDDLHALSAFFSHRDGRMKVQAIAWRLKNECGAPVWLENEIWTLKSEKMPRGFVRFWIDRKRP